MKIVKIVISLIVLIILGYAGYIAYGLTKIKNQNVRDLGVKYTFEDYQNAVVKKAGVEVPSPEAIYFGSDFTAEGTKKIEETFSEGEISAIQNYSNEKNGPFKNVQIRFLGNNQVEASGFVSHPKVNTAVYVKGSVIQTGSKSFSVDTTNIIAGSFSIPQPLRGQIDNAFESYVNDILSKIDGLNVEKVEILNGAVKFTGEIPQKVLAK